MNKLLKKWNILSEPKNTSFIINRSPDTRLAPLKKLSRPTEAGSARKSARGTRYTAFTAVDRERFRAIIDSRRFTIREFVTREISHFQCD